MGVGESILLAIVGILATWFFAWLYFRKGSSDLDAALRRLEGNHQKQLQAANALARMLEQSGMGKPSYDAEGNLTGIVITPSAHASAGFSATATATLIRGQPPQYDRQHEQPPSPEPEAHHA